MVDRPSAGRAVFLDELDNVERLLRFNPELGMVHAVQRSGAIRRILLEKTAYHLYYRYNPRHGELVVLAVWGATRGHTPKL